jgi:hypothetical protein
VVCIVVAVDGEEAELKESLQHQLISSCQELVSSPAP